MARGGAEPEQRARGGAAGSSAGALGGRRQSGGRGAAARAGGRHAAGLRPGCGSVAGLAVPHRVARAPLPGSLGVVPGTGSWRPGVAQLGGAGVDARGGAQALARDSGLRPGPLDSPRVPRRRCPAGPGAAPELLRRRPRPPVLKEVPPGLRAGLQRGLPQGPRPLLRADGDAQSASDSGRKSSFVDGALWAQRTCIHLCLVTPTETRGAGIASSPQ